MTLEQDYRTAVHHGHTDTITRIENRFAQLDAEDHARRNRPDAILAAALWYATQNIAVFPLQPQGKTPATRNGFKDATTNPTTIRAWWNTNPNYNLGVPTGHQFDVIDIDSPEGLTTMYTGNVAMIDNLTVIGVALTSRDAGRHIYVPPTGEGNKAAIWPGIDYRGKGGYVVAPPSVGPNGRRYRWTQPLNLNTPA